MKKIVKIICVAVVAAMLALTLASCDRAPGLYAWYGKVNVDYMLKMTIDVGDGEISYDVPFETYRNLFVYYSTLVSDTVVNSNNVTSLTTNQQKTAVLKEYTEDELTEYYALFALAEKLGVGLTEADMDRYKNSYEARVADFAEKLTDEDVKDFKGTKEEYAKYLYDKLISDLKLTPEYLEYSFNKHTLEKRIKQKLVPDLEDYISQCYYHYGQVYVEFSKGDEAAEVKASESIRKALEEIEAGADFDEVAKKYSNNSLYAGDFYFDAAGSIVNSADNSSVGSVNVNVVQSLEQGEHSGILMGDSDDETGYFAIIKREGFDGEFIYGNSDTALQMFRYSSVGDTVSSAYSAIYNDYVAAYVQNTRVEPYDANVYKLVKVNSIY